MARSSSRRSSPIAPLSVAIAAFVLCASPHSLLAGSLQFWNVDPLTAVTDEQSLGPAVATGTTPQPIRLVGPRNGFCSAQVVVGGGGEGDGSATAVDRLRVAIGPLRKGSDVLPPDAVRIRYASKAAVVRKVEGNYKIEGRYTNVSYYDALSDAPPAGASLLPVWVTVHIPADAQPGEYSGTLTVGATAVPVLLQVGAWRCPNPQDWATHVGLLQSPETLALQYGVALWSEEHWRLMEASLRAMAELGDRDLFLPVVNKTHLGNEWGMVRFTKDAEGRLTPDLTVLTRYLETYRKVGGNARSLVLCLWDPEFQGFEASGKRGKPVEKQIGVAVVDEGGALSEAMAPMYGEPGSEEFWRPVLDAIHAQVAKLGFPDDAILLGQAGDERPNDDTIAFFDKIAPTARWSLYTHGRGDPPPKDGTLTLGGLRVGLYETPYVPELRKSGIPADGVAGGWDLAFPVCCYPRVLIFQYSPLSQWRSMPEGTTAGEQLTGSPASAKIGFTRICLDYWDIGNRTLLGKYRSHWLVRMYRIGPRSLLAPGPSGPLGTVRYEMLREGLQECEARIAIEKALANGEPAKATRQECTDLLLERLNVRLLNGKYTPSGDYWHPENQTEQDGQWGIAPAWQDLALRLFNLAGLVAPAK